MADGSPRFQFPATPGMPLFPLSPERVNKQSYPLQISPSMPTFASPHDLSTSGFLANSEFSRQNGEFSPRTPSPSRQENYSPFVRADGTKFSPPKHLRTNSDVQGMVARFNSLDIKDKVDEIRKKDAAALKRAQMGREEAEAEVSRLKEENRAQSREIEEGKERERRVVKRLDVIMDDLHRSKETQAHAQTLYEKEIRRARKEAFKSSSVMVKLQEELKAARISLKLQSSDLELEKVKANKREQETFSAQYQLVGLQEDLNRALSQIKIVEEERDALKTSLKEEEVARIAAEGRIALPPAPEEEEELASPVKQKPQLRPASPEKEQPKIKLQLEQLRAELDEYRRHAIMAEEQVEFMKMECQFGCCSCRVAERRGDHFTHDGTFVQELEFVKMAANGMPTPPESMILDEDVPEAVLVNTENAESAQSSIVPIHSDALDNNISDDIAFSPTSGTFRKNNETEAAESAVDIVIDHADHIMSIENGIPTSQEMHVEIKDTPEVVDFDQALSPSELKQESPQQDHESDVLPMEQAGAEESSSVQVHAHIEDRTTQMLDKDEQPIARSPRTPPIGSNWNMSTTTTKVPLAEPGSSEFSAFGTPNITREEAIEQLRQRRGRARSVAGTPKKVNTEIATPRRDISAPEVRVGATRSGGRTRSNVRSAVSMQKIS